MTRSLAALLTLCAVTASAQTVRAPALGRSALPGLGSLSAVAGGLNASAAALPLAPSLAVPLARPVLPSPALQAPRPAAPSAPVLPASPAAAVLETASVPLARAAGNPSAQAPVLSSLFEGGRSHAAGAVLAAEPAARPSALLARNAVLVAPQDAPPPAPARPVWKTAGLYTLRLAAFLGALYGGFRVGDFAYLGLEGFGAWGLALSLPLLAGAAWWLGNLKNRSTLGRFVYAGLFASAGFVVVGQQAWDLFRSPLGLFVGVPVGILLALLSSGVVGRRRSRADALLRMERRYQARSGFREF